MSFEPHRHRLDLHADRADILALRTASGTPVELMRTWYRTQVFPRHSHDYFTLGVMLRGVGTLWYRGADRILRPGHVVVIPPGEVHTGGMARGNDLLSYFAVHLPAEVLAICADAHGMRGGRAPDVAAAIIHDPDLGAALRRLDVAMRAAPTADEEAGAEALNDAIGLLVRRYADCTRPTPAPEPTREPHVVRIAREIIEDCYADSSRTSLRALGLQTGVTPFHLVRVFTQTTGLSPHRYLVQTRVRRASQLLARGIPASFVAAMTGFVDQSHLTTQFKRYVGTTPASYQRCVVPAPR